MNYQHPPLEASLDLVNGRITNPAWVMWLKGRQDEDQVTELILGIVQTAPSISTRDRYDDVEAAMNNMNQPQGPISSISVEQRLDDLMMLHVMANTGAY